jgi:pseudoazurin
MFMGTLFKKIFIVIPVLLLSFELFSEVHTVKMLNQGSTGVMVFEPAVLKIDIGDTVTFVATDAAHNSASIPGMLPPNATAWNGQLSRDISVTFNIPGVYGYQCTPHAMMAMVGIIQVGDDLSNLQSVKNSASQFKTTFVMNQTRLDDYLSQLN